MSVANSDHRMPMQLLSTQTVTIQLLFGIYSQTVRQVFSDSKEQYHIIVNLQVHQARGFKLYHDQKCMDTELVTSGYYVCIL